MIRFPRGCGVAEARIRIEASSPDSSLDAPGVLGSSGLGAAQLKIASDEAFVPRLFSEYSQCLPTPNLHNLFESAV